MDTNLILDEIRRKLPLGKVGKVALDELQNKIDSLTYSQRNEAFLKIQDTNLKDPQLVFWVGNVLCGNFGVARFMIGDLGIGFARLGFAILAVIVSAMVDKDSGGNVLVSAVWIWWIVDLFLVGKKLRMQNLRKVLLIIDSVKVK